MKRNLPPHDTKLSTPVFAQLVSDPFHTLLNEQQAADYLGWTRRTLQQRRYYSLPPVYIKLPGSTAVRYRISEVV